MNGNGGGGGVGKGIQTNQTSPNNLKGERGILKA